MTNEVLKKAMELSEGLQWCKLMAKYSESDRYRLLLRFECIEGGSEGTLKCPDWLKDHIAKMAKKYNEKLLSDLEKL